MQYVVSLSITFFQNVEYFLMYILSINIANELAIYTLGLTVFIIFNLYRFGKIVSNI